MDSKLPPLSTPLKTASGSQGQKRKDAPDSTNSANKKSHTIISCPIAFEVLKEVGCTTDFLNSGKILAWALDPTDQAFLNIQTYFERSHEPGYGYALKILSILRIMTNVNSLETGALPFDHEDDPKNKGQLRKMLWHGTDSKNVPSILENGLKLPKNKSPDPYFGDGIYFSDNFSYSLDYCGDSGKFKDNKKRLAGYLFLADVLLGNIHKTYKLEPTAPQVKIRKPGGVFGETVSITVDSIQGCGASTPDPDGDQIIQGCTWPLGKILDDQQVPPDSDLDANEFVVYDTKKVIPKYLIKVQLRR